MVARWPGSCAYVSQSLLLTWPFPISLTLSLYLGLSPLRLPLCLAYHFSGAKDLTLRAEEALAQQAVAIPIHGERVDTTRRLQEHQQARAVATTKLQEHQKGYVVTSLRLRRFGELGNNMQFHRHSCPILGPCGSSVA